MFVHVCVCVCVCVCLCACVGICICLSVCAFTLSTPPPNSKPLRAFVVVVVVAVVVVVVVVLRVVIKQCEQKHEKVNILTAEADAVDVEVVAVTGALLCPAVCVERTRGSPNTLLWNSTVARVSRFNL